MDIKFFDPDDPDNSKKSQLNKDIELLEKNSEKFDQMILKVLENMSTELENMGFNHAQMMLALWAISKRMNKFCTYNLKQEVITAEIYMAQLDRESESKPGQEFG